MVEEIGMKLIVYKRYTDDINVATEDDQRTEATTDREVMEKIQREANSISTSIRATADYGSKYRDGKLPLLDVKSWIGRNKDGVIKIMHEHYMKDVSTRSLIHFNSAHPTNVKTNIVVNEASRILQNCSKEMK